MREECIVSVALAKRPSRLHDRDNVRTRGFLITLALALFCVVPVALGDLVERRGEPPPPDVAECGGDRVAGIWRGRNFLHGWSYITTMRIERAGGEAIRGSMSVTLWTGRGRPPPPCLAGMNAYRVRQPSRGTASGLRVDFRASAANIDRILCGSPQGYAPDHFTGTIAPNASVLRAVNNDNGGAVNEPVMFRRVRCL
jgi:hypothetical protein